MGLKHKKKRLLDIYGIGGGSGNADFANMTEEEKMQVRKDLGLYYSDIEENVTDTLWHNPNEIIQFIDNYYYSKVTDDIPGLDENNYDSYKWVFAKGNGEGGWFWSDEQGCDNYDVRDGFYFTQTFDDDNNVYYYVMSYDDYALIYFPQDAEMHWGDDKFNAKKGLYLTTFHYAVKLKEILEEDGNIDVDVPE